MKGQRRGGLAYGETTARQSDGCQNYFKFLWDGYGTKISCCVNLWNFVTNFSYYSNYSSNY
jgi:hypothetical protein